jgi:hypothetical protein
MTNNTDSLLRDHMTQEEAYQKDVGASLRDTAASLATVATRLEYNERAHAALLTGLSKLDGKLDDHEVRLVSIERSVVQAATVAKWFFGGGFVAACAAAYTAIQLLNSLNAMLGRIK